MSKKMWNKIFKSSKITRNSKISPAATAIAVKSNKRCSILEEFQQLHAYSGQQAEIQEKPKKLDREQQHQENQTHEVGEQQKQQLPLSKLLQKHIANADGSDANTASEYTLDAGSANSSVTKNSEIVQILANNADGILQKPASDKKVTPQATANANDQLISNRNYSNNSLPTSSNRKQQSTFSKVVSSFTLKRNNKSNGGTQKQQEVQNINENANVKAKSKSPQYNSNTIANTADPYPDAPAKLVPCVICRRTFNPVTLQKHVGICEKMATKKRNVFDSSRQRREGTELASYPLPKNFCLPSLNQEQRGQSPKPLQHIASPTFIRKKSNDSNELTRSTARASVRKLPASRNVKSHSKSPSGTFVPTTIPNNGAAASVDASIALPNNNQMVTSTVSTASFTRDRIRSSDRAQVKRIQQSPAAEQCPHCERCFGPKAYDRHVEWCKEKALQASIKQTSKTEQNLAKERLEARTKYRAPCLKTKRSINRDKYAGLACDEIEFGDSLKTIYGTHSNNSSDSNNTNGSNNNNSNIGQVNRIISNDNSNNINNSFANGIGKSKCKSNMSQSMTSSMTIESDLPLADKYDPFLSAKRQLEELCLSSPSNKPSFSTKLPNDSPQTLPTSAGFPSKMSTSLTLGTSIPSTSPLTTTNSQNQRNATATQDKTAASSNFRRASSLRGPRRSPLLSSRPLFAQKHRPTIQRGLSDEGPISTNFLKPEEYDEMPVRSVCVNDYALTKSPRVTRRDNSLSNRKQCLKLNMQGIAVTTSSPTTSSTNCAQNTPNHSAMPNVKSNEELNYSTSKYLSKTDSLAAFLNYEKELDKLNGQAAADAIAGVIASNDADERAPLSPAVNLNNPIITKELKDKSNALSKQNSAKSLKAEHSDTTEAAVASEKLDQHDAMKHLPTAVQNTPPKLGISPCERDNGSTQKSQTLRLKSTISLPQATSTPITKSNSGRTLTTPITTANYTQLPAVNLNDLLADSKAPPLSTLLHSSYSGDLKTSSSSSDYIDPKLINKCDNLPVKLNTVRRPKSHNSSYLNFSSSSSECSAKQNCTISQLTKLLPLTRPATAQQLHTHTRQAAKIPSKAMDISPRSSTTVGTQHTPNVQATLCERNISDGRNLLNRKKRLGRNQFLYDASPEANDSCSADDEANRSSLEYYESKYCSSYQQQRQQEPQPHSFVNMNSESGALQTPPIVPTLPIFEDFDFEEFLSSFENDDKQFALLKDCTEFLLNRTATKPRLALPTPSSHYKELYTQHTNNSNNITHHNTNQQQTNGYSNINNHFEFPNQISSQHTHPTLLLTPSRRSHDESRPISEEFAPIYTRCEELKRSNSNNDAYTQSNADDTFPLTRCNDPEHKKREIFISIETEPNEHGRSPISPDTLRNMVGNPQAMVEVEVDDCDNKFCKISDDDEQLSSIRDGGSSKSHAEDMLKMRHCSQYASGTHLPNVQLNNAKNLIQRMQNDFRQMSEEVGANIREAMTGLSSISGGSSSILYEKMWMNGGDGVGTHGTGTYVQSNTSSSKAPPQSSLTTVSSMCGIAPVSGTSGGVSGDACCDSDNVSSLDSYPISIKSSRRDVGAKLSADSAYGSLSRQRSSELSATPHRGAIRNRPSTSTSTVINSAMLIPKITDSQQYQKQKQNQQKQLQQEATQLYKYAPEKARPRHNSGSSSSENSDGSDCDIKCNQQLQQHEQLYDGIAGSNTNNNYISTHYAPAAHHTSNIMGGNRNNNNNNHNIGCNNESPLISPTIAARNFSNTTTHAAAVTPNDLQSTAIANSSVVATTAEQYSSNSSLSSTNASGVLSRSTSIITSMKMSKFCHECGAKFLIEQAKFCMECGVRRVVL
ncbi:serine-rich adhesin for platelets isoform X5 [Eurosta solidaginis]|uniref:serine-rich adhesin for platelets isoform X5 n=1 Tax=Eurosta solidaginis TaxID=178769 RepID=UPI0035317C1B